ncbi:MAG TPA: extracellular solute-binding protein [Erysipelotrichaceae bacterium]|nr:extracellular solute-binding protein [Erysipelotrichaceae bacterium]
MKKRKIISILPVLLFVCCSFLTSCKPETPNDDNLSEYVRTQKEKWYIGPNRKLSWYIGISWWPYTNSWTSYPVLNEVTQITGVTPKTSIAQDGDNTSLKLRMANDKLPDLITIGIDDPLIEILIEEDYVYSYDELIDRYSEDYVNMETFKSWCSEDFWKCTAWHTDNEKHDGKIYGLNSFYYPRVEDIGQFTFNVREDIYEAIGKPDMSTEEGFYNGLKAVKAAYPDMKPLSLPESWYYWIFEEAFGVKPYYVTEEGVKMRVKNPEFKNALLYLRKLYAEGLLDRDVFVNSDKTSELASGKIFCYPVTYWDLDSINAVLGDGHRFVAIEPLRGNAIGDDVRFQGTSRRGWTTTLISKKCSDPEAAIKFAQYMFSEDGNLLVCYGHENEHYNLVGTDQIERTPEVIAQRDANLTKFENETGIFTQRLFNYPYYFEVPSTNPYKVNNVEKASRYVYDNTVFTYKMTPSSKTRLGDISSKVWAKYNILFPQMVVAETEQAARDALTSAITEMERIGLSSLEDYWTSQYNKNILEFGDPFGK